MEAKTLYDRQVGVVHRYRVNEHQILAYASYCRFYSRLVRATPGLFLLGVGALAALMGFAVMVKGPSENTAPTIVEVPLNAEHTDAHSTTIVEPSLEPVYFTTGSDHIDEAGLADIQRARDELLAHPGSALLLMAYTDTAGTSKREDVLAQQRTAAIQEKLTGPGGIARSRIFVAELPKISLPKVPGNNQESKTNNSVLLHIVEFPR